MAMTPNVSLCLSRAVYGVDSGAGVVAGIAVRVDNDWDDRPASGVIDAGAGCVAPLIINNRCVKVFLCKFGPEFFGEEKLGVCNLPQ